jgi:RNA polymerase sigma-70 factor (ECF subfamily)
MCSSRLTDSNLKFSKCYLTERRYVGGIVRRSGIATADIEDAVQDVFCVLLSRITELDEQESLRGWLGRVATYVCRNRRRGDRRRAKWLMQQPLEPDCVRSSQCPATVHNSPESTRALDRWLEHLEHKQRQVLLLTVFEGRSARELSELLGVSPNTVASRLRAARRRLSALFVDDGDSRPR